MADDFKIGGSSFRKTNKQKGVNNNPENIQFDSILNDVMEDGKSKSVVSLDKINSATNPEEFMELAAKLINETLKNLRGPDLRGSDRTTASLNH